MGKPQTICNASAYRFLALDHLKAKREELKSLTHRLGLKGTILLAPEGLNLFVAGTQEAVQQLLAQLPLRDSDIKLSYSEEQPFSRMLVRLKKEIIAFGHPTRQQALRLSPQELKQWLDQGRPVTLLDTRNDYEVRMGTFRGALELGLTHFRDFPAALDQLAHLKDTPIVTFCTGGIRCEKAAPWMQEQGFSQVWQLEGGILRYFEEVGGDHYQGECFVFDRRVGVDPALQETDSVVCPVCLAPLTPAEQSDPRYRRGQSCPHCFRQCNELQVRQEALERVSQPLPGSQPATNRVPIHIPARCQGMSLEQALQQLFPHIQDWSNLRDAQDQIPDKNLRVQAGQRYFRVNPMHIEPPVRATIEILYLDQALLLLNKPAPLPMHPCGRYERNTLRHLLELAFGPESPKPAHRLDANTTGLLVCARTHHFAKKLQAQFALGQVDKRYLALVEGSIERDEFEVEMAVASEPSAGVLREVGSGRPALTRFRVLQRRSHTTLLEAQPITGRTHQIRVHLGSIGHPIVGDPASQTLGLDDPPLLLHSWKVQLRHPLSGHDFSFECPAPSAFGL
jgi:UPF0176 protein